MPGRVLRRRAVLVVLIALGVAALFSTGYGLVSRSEREAVKNGNAVSSLQGWDAKSNHGPLELNRAHLTPSPAGISSGVEIRRRAEEREWARAVVRLKDPVGFLEVGKTYRLRAFVRNSGVEPQTVGLLLANENYEHRPTRESDYQTLNDDAWHELGVTFSCEDPPAPDTGVYLSLPTSGAIHVEVTGVSLQEENGPEPPRARGDADQVVTFPGSPGGPVDPALWAPQTGGHGWGNDELQTYTSSRANASVDGSGRLNITARREGRTGGDGIDRNFTSARLSSRGKFEIQPGSYVEASIEAPVGAGVWPAFWLMGSNFDKVGWPACGELDILEVVGSNPGTVYSALHMAAKSDPSRDMPYGEGDEGGSTRLSHSLDSKEHRYGVYFDRKMVVFYLDGSPTLSYTAEAARASGRTWPFDQPQFMILNVAVGGRESPDGTQFPRTMSVAAIKIWKDGVPF